MQHATPPRTPTALELAQHAAQQAAATKQHIERLYASCLRSRKRIAELEAAIALRDAGRTQGELVMRSQYGEDVLLWEILGRPL